MKKERNAGEYILKPHMGNDMIDGIYECFATLPPEMLLLFEKKLARFAITNACCKAHGLHGVLHWTKDPRLAKHIKTNYEQLLIEGKLSGLLDVERTEQDGEFTTVHLADGSGYRYRQKRKVVGFRHSLHCYLAVDQYVCSGPPELNPGTGKVSFGAIARPGGQDGLTNRELMEIRRMVQEFMLTLREDRV